MNFYLPDFCNGFGLNTFMCQLLEEHPEYFYDNVKIPAFYGTFPGAIWNGGRTMAGIATRQEVEETVRILNDHGIALRYTFTNSLLDESHLHDTYCNMLMEIADTGHNEIIINSPLLENYLRERYPNFKYILSTTRCERDLNKINEATQQYDLVVTDYRDNNNIDFLQGIQNKSKIELLVNAYCNPDCKYRKRHYELISFHQLNFDAPEAEQDQNILSCPTYSRDFYDILDFPTVITVEDLYQKYTAMGFSHFKIEGRTMHIATVIESYVYYLIKPEYRDKVRLLILKTCIR